MSHGPTLVAVLRDDLAVLTRVLGVFRRRGMSIARLELRAGPDLGMATLSAGASERASGA